MTIVETEIPAATSEPLRTSRKTIPDSVLTLGVAAYVVVLGVIAAVAGVHFFYVGDNPESFIPLWHHFGTELRAGHWWTMEASAWMGGNYAGEAAYAQWNPFLLLAYIALSFFGNLAIGASAVMIAMLALLGAGAFLLMRSYGAAKAPSVALAGAVPVTGFTLFYEAAGWPAGLAAFVGVTFFWLAVRKQTTGKWPPIVTFVFGFLAVTTGNPYALLGIIIVLGGAFIELLLARRWRPAIHLVVTGILVGATSLLVFLPLLGVQPVTVRQELAGIVNDTFMVPDLGDLSGASTPSYLPTITNWGGSVVESLPSTYLAWFALPLLPWIRWGALWRVLRTRSSILIVTGIFAVTVLGPSNLWLFRWPIRLIEYLYLGILLILALGITVGIARTAPRRRIGASAVIVAFGTFLAMAATPNGAKIHAVSFVLVAGLIIALAFVWRRWGTTAAMSVILAGTVLVTGFQTLAYPRGTPTIIVPDDLSQMTAQASSFEGTVLQLAEQRLAGPEAINTGKLLFGNLSAPLPYESINRYSGISFRALSEALCIDYKGVTCPDSYNRLWKPVAHTQGDLADALGISTLVIHKPSLPDVVEDGPPAGWKQVESDDVRVVWVRDEPLSGNGRVSGTSDGVTATSVFDTETAEDVDVNADQSGFVTFARLAWPGYSVTVDGAKVDYVTSKEGLLQVPVPQGTSTVSLTYAAPGLAVGWMATGAAALLAIAQSVIWYLGRRRAGALPALSAPEVQAVS
ncbi:hypothetical protein ACH3VR_10245 [Microbacterium sp. B2969]|uniref:Membrane protein YfhO n=1 Tax=Microbacterium alkaliflavum TaxID=3248839 RepID=A0ABW7Q7C7_9MICO